MRSVLHLIFADFGMPFHARFLARMLRRRGNGVCVAGLDYAAVEEVFAVSEHWHFRDRPTDAGGFRDQVLQAGCGHVVGSKWGRDYVYAIDDHSIPICTPGLGYTFLKAAFLHFRMMVLFCEAPGRLLGLAIVSLLSTLVFWRLGLPLAIASRWL